MRDLSGERSNVRGESDVLLRTQTSGVQVHVMEDQYLPIYIIAPGKVYRRDVADPVSYTHLEFAKAALAKYPDMLTAGIDAKNGEVAVAGWREGAGVPAEELIAEMGKLGFKHLVYTDISRDGMQTGIDAARYVEVARVFGNPVIASGGVANIEDVRNLASVADSIEGVIAGRAVYEGSLSVEEAAKLCG